MSLIFKTSNTFNGLKAFRGARVIANLTELYSGVITTEDETNGFSEAEWHGNVDAGADIFPSGAMTFNATADAAGDPTMLGVGEWMWLDHANVS